MIPKEVFISYHTRSSAETTRRLCTALEGAGISCWYAPRDVEGDYATSIVKAINGCKIFLLILNKEADMSEDVRNEINIAFERVRRHEEISLLPFRVDDCDLSEAIMYYLGRVHMMDGGTPPEMLKISELINRVSYLLGKEAVRSEMLGDDNMGKKQEYRIVGSAVYADNNFVGRSIELEEMHRMLTGNYNKLFLTGMGGIGKTELVKSYCERHKDEYDVILWISFDTSLQQTIINDFTFPIQGLERSDYPNDNDEEYFKRKLKILRQIADNRVLIILDNFDTDGDSNLQEFCAGGYSVLFTTRYHSLCGNLPEFEVKEISDEGELMALFQAEYKRNIQDKEAVGELLSMLYGHPLSIRLVASAMQSRRIAPDKMLAMLKEGAAEMKKQNLKAAEIIFGRIQQAFSLAVLSEEEQIILKNLALTPLQGIAVETLYEWCGFEDFEVIDGLISKSWVVHNSATDEVHLHPLVADLMSEELGKDSGCCDKLLNTFIEKNEKLVYVAHDERRLLSASCTSACERLPKAHPKRVEIMWSRAKSIFETSSYLQAIDMLKDLLAQTDDLFWRLIVSSKISQGYCLAGYPEDAVDYAQRGLQLVEGIPDEELSRQVGNQKRELSVRLAEAYRHMGNYDVAEGYARKALGLVERFYYTSVESSKGWAEVHLAQILFKRNAKGDNEESLALYEHALTLFTEVDDKFSPAFCYQMIGQIYMRLGRFDEALAESKRAYDLLVQYLGERHTDIAIILALKANIYRTMGHEEEALRYYGRAHEILVLCGHKRYERLLEQIVKSGEVGYIN